MGFTNTPNMSLPIPAVGNEPGPQYATDVNNALTLVDSHDHSPGKGVLITPSGLDISTDLPFNGNYATSLAGATFLSSATPGLQTVYVSGVDLFFVDGIGNNVRITQSGSVAGTPGSIANLVPPASATYVASSSTFVWQSNVSAAANMDFGSAIFRNVLPNSTFGITMSAPASLSSNNSITLPLQPASKKFLTMTSAGVQAADTDVDNSTIVISSDILQVPAGGITDTQIAAGTITTDKLAFILGMKSQIFNSSGTWTRPTGVDWVIVRGCGGGTGGGGGGVVGTGTVPTGGGAGGNGAAPYTTLVQVSGNVTVTIGGGSGNANAGANGSTSNGNSSFGTVIFKKASDGGNAGGSGTSTSTNIGGAGSGTYTATQQETGGGSGGGGAGNAGAGAGSTGGGLYDGTSGGAGGTGGTTNAGGGGGGGGAGVGAGAAGGAGINGGNGNTGSSAAANTGGGGGGGGGGGIGFNGGAGHAGGSGQVIVSWVEFE